MHQPATQIASGLGLSYGMSWSPNGYIVYSSMAPDTLTISRIDPDGRNSSPLTSSATNYNPVVSSDGRFVVFSSNLDGRFNIWRMNADGGELKQLTFTDANYYPSISPDGKWVAYDNMTHSKLSIWKVPSEGGEPKKIIDGYRMPVFSLNSPLIAARYDEESGTKDVAIFSADGGEALQHMPIPILEWQRVQWLDDHTLSYIDSVNGASNLYSYDLNTKVSKQLTFFESDQIVAYTWSPDFKRVACQRVTNTANVTIISSER
jgi:Tol biopolymer transport system component